MSARENHGRTFAIADISQLLEGGFGFLAMDHLGRHEVERRGDGGSDDAAPLPPHAPGFPPRVIQASAALHIPGVDWL